MRDQQLIDRIKTAKEIPTLSAVAAKVMHIAMDQNVSIRNVAEAIQKDGPLTAKVLRSANSARFATSRQVTSIHDAIMVLGLNVVRGLAFSLSVIEAFEKIRNSNFHPPTFWKSALAASEAARRLAQQAKFPLVEEAAIVALIQDVGIVALIIAAPDEYANVRKQPDLSEDELLARETDVLGINHAQVSGIIAERWGLPDLLVTPLTYCHKPEAVPPGKPREALLARFASSGGLVGKVLLGDKDGDYVRKAVQQIGSVHKISQPEAHELFGAIASELHSVAQLYGVDIGSSKSWGEILTEANEKLSQLAFTYEDMMRELNRTVDELRKTKLELTEAYQKLEELSRTDPLTGVNNRRAFEDHLKKAWSHTKESKETISIIFVDIDHFKNVNDTYGHQVGDLVLRKVARSLARSVRGVDFVARYGGEEFVALLWEIPVSHAVVIAEAMRNTVAKREFFDAERRFHVTISCGVASSQCASVRSAEDLVKVADAALYSAKKSGRNRVVSVG